MRDGVGVLDLPGFTRLRLVGPGARAHVDRLTATRLPGPDRIGLVYFPDDRGRILTEMSVLAPSGDEVGLITAAVAQWHDADVLRKGLPEGVELQDWSDKAHCFIVTGPKARALLASLTDADLSLPWLSVQYDVHVAGCRVALIRVSFAGELGWEIHCGVGDGPVIYDALLAGGATPFGMHALNSLRIEKGYRAWKGDLSTDYSLLEGGLDRFIRWDKDFPGKAALEAERQQGSEKRFVTRKVEAGDYDPPYMANIWHGGAIVGEVTSAAGDYRVGACLALGMLRTDLVSAGTKVEVEVYGTRVAAQVLADGPAWDPANARLKA